jgi:predicted nucleic acid-binding protein
MSAIIDTNILIELLRNKPNVTVARNAVAYKRGGNKFLMFHIVYYEYRRGALRNGIDSDGRAKALDAFVSNECEWVEFDLDVAQKASWVWSRNRSLGSLGDADFLIAAAALRHRVAVATRNRRHIGQFGVEVLDWFEERPRVVNTRLVP